MDDWGRRAESLGVFCAGVRTHLSLGRKHTSRETKRRACNAATLGSADGGQIELENWVWHQLSERPCHQTRSALQVVIQVLYMTRV